MNTYVIAELGSTWLFSRKDQENLMRGSKLIRLASEAGANAVKVQWVSDPVAMAKRRKVPAGTYRHLAWPLGWHEQFAYQASVMGLQYISTVFLPDDVALLAPWVNRYKLASLEFRSPSLWEALQRQDKPVIYSTGCCAAKDIQYNGRLADRLLMCTASYPCKPEEMNLAAMKIYGFANSYDGLSDHSGNVLTGAFAVMRGATMIEAHIRLDETPTSNPDYKHSLTTAQFTEYVANIRLAEAMLGDGRKKIERGERALMKHRVRR
jgi:sialic acid synthase SpsE